MVYILQSQCPRGPRVWPAMWEANARLWLVAIIVLHLNYYCTCILSFMLTLTLSKWSNKDVQI